MPGPAVRVQGLWKRFGTRDALAGVTLQAETGACLALLGSNGSGKTTLLRILATLSQPTEGDVEVLGLPLPKGAPELRARMGVVFRRHLLPREFPLRDALAMYADLYGIRDAAPRIEELVDRVGLGQRLRDPVSTFSRGMGQRASLCRALLHDPDLLLLDEPFTGLDAGGCSLVEDVIRERCAAGRTVVLVTHDLPRAASLAQRAVVLNSGRIIHDGDPHVAARRAAGAAA